MESIGYKRVTNIKDLQLILDLNLKKEDLIKLNEFLVTLTKIDNLKQILSNLDNILNNKISLNRIIYKDFLEAINLHHDIILILQQQQLLNFMIELFISMRHTLINDINYLIKNYANLTLIKNNLAALANLDLKEFCLVNNNLDDIYINEISNANLEQTLIFSDGFKEWISMQSTTLYPFKLTNASFIIIMYKTKEKIKSEIVLNSLTFDELDLPSKQELFDLNTLPKDMDINIIDNRNEVINTLEIVQEMIKAVDIVLTDINKLKNNLNLKELIKNETEYQYLKVYENYLKNKRRSLLKQLENLDIDNKKVLSKNA